MSKLRTVFRRNRKGGFRRTKKVITWVFYGNNTLETWQDAKELGGLDELDAHRPKPSLRVWALYDVFGACIRETEHMTPVKACVFSKAAEVLNYENDIAVKLLQSADDFYLKLCAEKTKRMQAK